MPDIKVLNPKMASNQMIATAIWNDASLEYQSRIPSADQGNIRDTFNMLQEAEYRPQLNEFMDALINRIGDVIFKSKVWSNPLKPFKRGMLQFGDTIEEIAGGILQAKRYDPNQCYTDVFACSKGEIMSNFHSINRMDRYDLTINRQLLRRAFVNDYGLQQLIDIQMNMPYNSDELDEYLIMRNLFAELDRIDGFYKVEVPDANSATTRQERTDLAFTITEAVKGMVGKLRFMSGLYNSSGVPTFSRPNELVLFTTPEFAAMLDVNVLAMAFNVSMAELNVRTILVDDFGIDGCQAILADENIFVCADTLFEFENIYNPKGLAWNWFLHHHGIYSVSRFVNSIMFTTEAGTNVPVPSVDVTGVDVTIAEVDGTTPAFAPLGGKLRLNARVTGTSTENASIPQGVVWSISKTDGTPLKQGTFIDAEGVLHVDKNEGNKSVTITATATFINPSKPMSEQTYPSGSLDVGIGEAINPSDEVSSQNDETIPPLDSGVMI